MSADLEDPILDDIDKTPFPAPTKQAASFVKGIHTDVSSIYFTDKIMITISQGGILSQWVRHFLLHYSLPEVFLDTGFTLHGVSCL